MVKKTKTIKEYTKETIIPASSEKNEGKVILKILGINFLILILYAIIVVVNYKNILYTMFFIPGSNNSAYSSLKDIFGVLVVIGPILFFFVNLTLALVFRVMKKDKQKVIGFTLSAFIMAIIGYGICFSTFRGM